MIKTQIIFSCCLVKQQMFSSRSWLRSISSKYCEIFLLTFGQNSLFFTFFFLYIKIDCKSSLYIKPTFKVSIYSTSKKRPIQVFFSLLTNFFTNDEALFAKVNIRKYLNRNLISTGAAEVNFVDQGILFLNRTDFTINFNCRFIFQ